jgi:hypothetical protein
VERISVLSPSKRPVVLLLMRMSQVLLIQRVARRLPLKNPRTKVSQARLRSFLIYIKAERQLMLGFFYKFDDGS